MLLLYIPSAPTKWAVLLLLLLLLVNIPTASNAARRSFRVDNVPLPADVTPPCRTAVLGRGCFLRGRPPAKRPCLRSEDKTAAAPQLPAIPAFISITLCKYIYVRYTYCNRWKSNSFLFYLNICRFIPPVWYLRKTFSIKLANGAVMIEPN